MVPHITTAAACWGHGPWGGMDHAGEAGWWLIFPIGFLVFLFGVLAVAALYVVRRTRAPRPPSSGED